MTALRAIAIAIISWAYGPVHLLQDGEVGKVTEVPDVKKSCDTAAYQAGSAATLCVLREVCLFHFARCCSTLHSDPGYELEVTVASDTLVISCEPCDEDYYKSDEGAE